MMKKILSWLASLFTVDVVWIEKDHGHWVKQRRYHPVVKAVVLVCVLSLGVASARIFLKEPRAPETETPSGISQDEISRDEALQPHEIDDYQLETDDSPEQADDYPGPVPDGLEVADDEYWIRISKSNFGLYLYRGLEVEKSYEVAVGRNPGDKERVGDNRTPNGIFTVQSIENSRSWFFDFGDGNGPIRGAYGPWFIRLRTGWRGIGIHGTHDPDSLGTMASEGCVRMHNYDLEELKQLVFINMKVVIEE